MAKRWKVYHPTNHGFKRWGYRISLPGKDRRESHILHPITGKYFQTREEVETVVRSLNEKLFDLDGLAWARSRWSTLAPQEKAAILFVRYKGTCQYCGRLVYLDFSRKSSSGRATVDHKFPLAAGGTDILENCTLACFNCNMAKGSGNYLDFIHRPQRRHA